VTKSKRKRSKSSSSQVGRARSKGDGQVKKLNQEGPSITNFRSKVIGRRVLKTNKKIEYWEGAEGWMCVAGERTKGKNGPNGGGGVGDKKKRNTDLKEKKLYQSRIQSNH